MSYGATSGEGIVEEAPGRHAHTQGRRFQAEYNLKNNWMVTLLMCCALVVLLAGGVILLYLESRFVEMAGEGLAVAAVDIADKLDHQMAERYGDIQMMARSQTFRGGDAKKMSEYLQWMSEVYPLYEWLGVTDATGRIIAATDSETIGQDRSRRLWFRSVRDLGSLYLGEPGIDQDSHGINSVALTSSIRGGAGEFLGVITARVAVPRLEDTFVRTVIALQEQWGTDVRIEYQFINRAGEVITDSILREERQINLRRMGVPSAQLVEDGQPGFVAERHIRREVDVVTGYAMTKGIEEQSAFRWGVLVRVDRDDIVRPIRATVAKIGLAGIGMLTPLVGMLVWSLRRECNALATAVEERVRAQEAEHKFQHLVASAPDAIIMIDKNGRIVLSNRRVEALFGFAPDELFGQPIEILVPERLRARHHEHCVRLAATTPSGPMAAGFDLAGRRRDGTEFPVEIALSHMETSEGRFVIASVRDITERHTIQQELRAAKEAAEASARVKSEFLATMSHEIRTPINGVIGMTDLLLDTALTPEQREFGEMIRYSGDRLLDVVNDILDFSKIEARKVSLEAIDFNLRTTVEGVVLLLAERAYAKELELVYLIHANVPILLRGDPGRLRQVLINLVGNAIKFTERGEVVVTVKLTDGAECDGTEDVDIRCEVADTGIGLTAEQRTRIFRPFVQADSSTTRKYGGTGLGLIICKELVGLMRGEIGVESVPGEGSLFWFTACMARQPNSPQIQPPVEAALRGRRCLIVDEKAINRKVLAHQLGARGILHESVEDGVRALDRLRTAAAGGMPFDLAILDLHMSVMGGLELARRIKEDSAICSVRLVVLASLGRRGDAKIAQEAGIAAYLTKPIRHAQLTACLSAVMEQVSPPIPIITRHSVAESQAGLCGRVLIVDDNPMNQKIAARMAVKLGCSVDIAATGREALEAVARTKYDAVLMDCQMPDIDGFDAATEIRKREGGESHVPIIAMTANTASDDRTSCLAAGMDDCLCKPFEAKAFAEMLARWVAGSEQHPWTIRSNPLRGPSEDSSDGWSARQREPVRR